MNITITAEVHHQKFSKPQLKKNREDIMEQLQKWLFRRSVGKLFHIRPIPSMTWWILYLQTTEFLQMLNRNTAWSLISFFFLLKVTWFVIDFFTIINNKCLIKNKLWLRLLRNVFLHLIYNNIIPTWLRPHPVRTPVESAGIGSKVLGSLIGCTVSPNVSGYTSYKLN